MAVFGQTGFGERFREAGICTAQLSLDRNGTEHMETDITYEHSVRIWAEGIVAAGGIRPLPGWAFARQITTAYAANLPVAFICSIRFCTFNTNG